MGDMTRAVVHGGWGGQIGDQVMWCLATLPLWWILELKVRHTMHLIKLLLYVYLV